MKNRIPIFIDCQFNGSILGESKNISKLGVIKFNLENYEKRLHYKS